MVKKPVEVSEHLLEKRVGREYRSMWFFGVPVVLGRSGLVTYPARSETMTIL